MNATTLQTVTSADGTTIAYEKLGAGPAVVLVCGGSVDRWSNAGLAAVLAADFSVYNTTGAAAATAATRCPTRSSARSRTSRR